MKTQRYKLSLTNLSCFNKDDKNVLLLGPWCNSSKDFLIADYHWSNKKKFCKDYKYLEDLYEKILHECKIYFNNYHKVNYSLKFWRIYIGPWLGYFLQISFDRFEIIRSVFNNYSIQSIKYIKIEQKLLVTKDIESFIKTINTDTWNQKLFTNIIFFLKYERLLKKKIVKKNFLYKDHNDIESYFKKKNIKYFLLLLYEYIFFFFTKNQKYLLLDTYLDKWNEILLNFKLFQLPIFFKNFYISLPKVDFNLRNKSKLTFTTKNNFEKFVKKNFFFYLPISFFEGFKGIDQFVNNKLFWPNNPKIIFTSHALVQKTISSFYCAKKIESGTKLIHGQHGGVYGQLKLNWQEKHEMSISDIYLNWGWKKNSKNRKFGIIKSIDKIKRNLISSDKFNTLLFTPRTQPVYSNELIDSRFRSSEMIYHLNDCLNFIKNIDYNIVDNNFLLRLHAKKYGWNEEELFSKHFPSLNIDQGYVEMSKLIKKSRIVVFSYNATGYLECLAANIPTVVFWNNKSNLLREDAKKNINLLKKNNIFFNSGEEAAKHINKYWNEVDKWWHKSSTQSARIKFCNLYAKQNNNKVNELKNLILNTK